MISASVWRDAVRVYLTRRQLIVFAMGFSSGLPLLLGFSTLSFWLRQEGVSLAAIGGLLTVATPYSLKFLWAPMIDHVRLPLFGRLGLRRGWLLAIQLALIAAIALVGRIDPATALPALAAAAFLMAFLSASQDIVIDAYRIEILTEAEQGAGAAMTQAGYRIGLLVAGAGALALADVLAWSTVYAIMAAFMLVGVATTWLAPEPVAGAREARFEAGGFFATAVVGPLRDFALRRGALLILVFVLLYKYGDAVAGAMANPFFVDLGFSGSEIAAVTNVFGVAMTMAGVFAGGVLVARLGIVPALLWGGAAQALTNLTFAALALAGHDLWFLAAAVGVDSFAGGLGSAAFVAYLSALCNVAFTATQYALLTSLMALGRTLLAASSGVAVEAVGWPGFFVGTTLLAVPALGLLIVMARRGVANAFPKTGRR